MQSRQYQNYINSEKWKQIKEERLKIDGYSLVPISLYFKGSLVKLELGVGKGKKLYDKRQDIAKKDAERRMQKAMRQKIRDNS